MGIVSFNPRKTKISVVNKQPDLDDWSVPTWEEATGQTAAKKITMQAESVDTRSILQK